MIRTAVKNLNITDMWLATRALVLSYETSIFEKIIVLLEKIMMIYLVYYDRNRLETGYLVYYDKNRPHTG
jgi:hypothetical protein